MFIKGHKQVEVVDLWSVWFRLPSTNSGDYLDSVLNQFKFVKMLALVFSSNVRPQ